MSISPNDDLQRSAPSSPASSSPAPICGHGSVRRDRSPLALQAEIPHSAISGGSPLASSGFLSDESFEISGSTIRLSGGSCESSANMIVLGVPDTENGSSICGIVSQYQATGRGGISSQFRSDQINGKTCGTSNSLHSDNLASGSNGLQVNASQSVSRRNQVVNANHLLNFQYDPISRPQSRIPPPRKPQKIKPYNKDLFLQANYKFVVLDTGGYQLESMNPDKMLQWEDVVCVRYSTPFPVQCPICLESPLCPQITSCGHIYCFPCILRYLLMGEEDHKGECWKKCPLCFMMISCKDLYTIHIDHVKQFNVGDHAHFRLLARLKDSLVPSLKNQEGDIDLMPFSSGGMYDSFSKFVLTSDVELSVREAKSDLNNWLSEANSGFVDNVEKLPYVCAALEQLQERMKNWMEHRVFSGSPPLVNSSSPPPNLKVANTTNKVNSSLPYLTSNARSANSDTWQPAGRTLCTRLKHEGTELSGKVVRESSQFPFASVPESHESPEKVITLYEDEKVIQRNANYRDAKEKESYTFYQAIDGQHLILHPLNMKCLLHHYGCYDMLPQRISGEILELETVTQSEAMRRRYRFLSHFSLTTTFQLCEIDMKEILPPSSLTPFIDEIKKREKQRKRVAKKEQEEKVKAEVAELNCRLMSLDQSYSSQKRAEFSMDDFTALGSGTVPSTSPPVTTERKLFSNVTRLGFAAAHDSPSLRAENSANSSESIEKAGETSAIQGPRAMAAPSFAKIISTAASQAMPISNDIGKKGKKPTKVLLSTAGGRRY